MTKKYNCLFFGFLFSVTLTNSQTLRRPISSAYAGLSAYSINHADVFSFTTNQAALAQLKNSSAAFFGERKFLLSDLNSYTTAVGVTSSTGNFGLKAAYNGFTDYNETQIGLAYGRKLGTKVDIGAQFNYNGISISSGYGNASAISVEVGTILHLTDKLHAGLHINNPVGGNYGKDKLEKLSSVYAVGFGYDASEKFLISAEIEKEEDQPVNINAGFQYRFIPQLMVRGGMSSATSSAFIGLGLTIKSFRLDITTGYHPQLGISPGVLLLFNLSTSRNKGNQNEVN